MKIHGYYNDGAVIQAEKPFIIKGSTTAKAQVTATIKGIKTISAYAVADDNGDFKINFPAVEASFAPYSLSVFTNNDCVTFNDILFGDVYWATGQSNMEYQLKFFEDSIKLFNTYSSHYIRIQTIKNTVLNSDNGCYMGSPTEFYDYLSETPWIISDDYQNVVNCTGFGFIFAGEIFRKTKRPIGIVDSSVGGSSVEHWYSREYQLSEKGLREYDDRAKIVNGLSRVGAIWTEKVCPLFDFNFKGMIWYQGESNCYNEYDGLNYAKMCGDMIWLMRSRFGYDFPIALVDIAIHNLTRYGVSYVNEQLLKMSDDIKDVIAIPVYDLPVRWKQDDKLRNYHPIHPTTKHLTAIRTADMFFEKFIKRGIFEAPRITDVKQEENYLLVTVKTEKPLKSHNGKPIFGFAIAGEDKKYYTAKAEIISNNQVKVFNDYVLAPKYLTYAFFNLNADCNLFGGNLPVYPYRSEPYVSIFDDAIYANPNPVYTCNVPKIWVSYSVPQFGGAGYEATWTTAKLAYGDCSSVKVTDNGVELKYTPDIKNYYFTGVSPNVSVTGLDNGLSTYDYIDVTFTTDKNVEFNGLLVQTASNERFMISPDVTKVNAGDTVTAKLKLNGTAQNSRYEQVLLTSEIRKSIFAIQFLFRAEGYDPGKIVIKSVELHD